MKKILALGLIQVTFCINFFEIANSTALFSDNDIAELILPEFNIFPSACNFIGKSGFYVHKGQMANRRVLVRVRGFVFTSPLRTIVWRTLESWVQDFYCKFLGTKYETSKFEARTMNRKPSDKGVGPILVQLQVQSLITLIEVIFRILRR